MDYLERLLISFAQFPAGGGFDVCVVVNSTSDERISIPNRDIPVVMLYRENLGMNIGAWDHGWRTHQTYADYLFLQDECYVIRGDWLAAFRRRSMEAEVGMVGESINRTWDKPWDVLQREQAGVVLSDHPTDGKPTNRVEQYLKFLSEARIDPGKTGRHLRSLVWYFRRDVLSEVGGFPRGRNYAECIAAEIGVSKLVESRGLSVEQVDDDEPFRFIRHREWNQDSIGAPYTHSSSLKRRIEQLESPSWQMLCRMVARKLKTSLSPRKGKRA
jgi:hypothetical protein